MRCCSSLTSTALSNEAPAQPAWAEARYDCVAAAGADPPATFPLSEGRSARSIQPQPQPTCGGSVVPFVWSHSHLPAMRVATLPQAHRLAPDGGEHVAHHAEHWCFLADRGCPWCHGSSAFRSHELFLVLRTTDTQGSSQRQGQRAFSRTAVLRMGDILHGSWAIPRSALISL
jgi:hypothetical protein